MRWLSIPSVLVFLFVFSLPARAEEWPGWRGPRGDGTSTETGVPTRWSPTENICWKAPIPGKGHSSPIVWGERVFVTTCLEDTGERQLLCLDRRDGRLLWQKTVFRCELEKLHRLNSRASSTPATDGKHVYVSFQVFPKGSAAASPPHMLVACYDFDGHEVWRQLPGEFHSRHGFCSPPVLYKDLVILNGDQDAEAWLVALDRKTGKECWRTDRPNRTRSYCPPLIVDAAGKKQMVLSGSLCVASYDPDTGKQLWIIDGPTEQYVASLVYQDGVFFLTAGYPTYHLMGIRPDGTGNVTDTHVLWHDRRGGSRYASYVPSPIAHGHHFFVVSDEGHVSCLETRTGRRLWSKKLGRRHSASPVSVDGHLYFPSDDGVTYVLKAGPTFELVSKNDLKEEIYASPAVSRGQLFLRTLHHLYCIGEEPANAATGAR